MSNSKITKPMSPEKRSYHGELRAAGEEGIIEGYIAVWGTVDSYNSSFQRGAFTKTLQERGHRVKVLWNHEDTVIGTPIELREDDTGVFVRAQLVMTVPKARETHELIKAGAIDTFSFGFRTVKDKWVDGVRVITEVMLMEISPVIFEANSSAMITGVRNMQVDDKRAQQYKSTYDQYEIGRRGDLILSALYRTLDDIWYSSAEGDSVRSMVTEALAEFTGMYGAYTEDLITMRERDLRGSPVQITTRSFLSKVEKTPEQFAATTSLTIDEVRSLLAGKPAVDKAKLQDLPEEIVQAIQAERRSKLEALCAELRDGLTEEEAQEIRSLLPDQQPEATTAILQALTEFRSSLSN
jgi:HK97 family phage prohead protease